jgi:hypothetical protein
MTRNLTPQQLQHALREHRFPTHDGWTMTTPTASAIVATNGSESFNIELIHDANPASHDDQLCTALGRLLLTMRDHSPTMTWAIAAPHTDAWLATLERVPLRVLATVRLTLMLVGENSVTDYPNTYEYDERALLDDEDLSDLVLGEGADDDLDAFLNGL